MLSAHFGYEIVDAILRRNEHNSGYDPVYSRDQFGAAVSHRGISYDIIDAHTMLCSDVGLLGLCTWCHP